MIGCWKINDNTKLYYMSKLIIEIHSFIGTTFVSSDTISIGVKMINITKKKEEGELAYP